LKSVPRSAWISCKIPEGSGNGSAKYNRDLVIDTNTDSVFTEISTWL